jgi:NCAIR mutase (PurE)-related protein
MSKVQELREKANEKWGNLRWERLDTYRKDWEEIEGIIKGRTKEQQEIIKEHLGKMLDQNHLFIKAHREFERWVDISEEAKDDRYKDMTYTTIIMETQLNNNKYNKTQAKTLGIGRGL